MWGPPLPLCLLGWPPCLPYPRGSPPFPFQKPCVHCPRKVIFLRRMVLFEAFNGVGGVVVSLGGGYAFPLTAPVRGVGVGADQQRDVQLLGRVSDGEDNLGEIKVGGSASWSQTLEGCSEQSWQCCRGRPGLAAPTSLATAPRPLRAHPSAALAVAGSRAPLVPCSLHSVPPRRGRSWCAPGPASMPLSQSAACRCRLSLAPEPGGAGSAHPHPST